MYVCVCNKVSDREIRDAADRGITTMEQLAAELRVATCCGRCHDCARRVLDDALAEQWAAVPELAMA